MNRLILSKNTSSFYIYYSFIHLLERWCRNNCLFVNFSMDQYSTFDACADLLRQKTLALINPKPLTLNQNEIAALGATNYFYVLASDAGLIGNRGHWNKLNGILFGFFSKVIFFFEFIDPDKGGQLTVGDFTSKAKQICDNRQNNAVTCMDMTYINVLLKDGYGLNPTTKINVSVYSVHYTGYIFENVWYQRVIRNNLRYSFVQVFRKINNYEVTWALGCAFDLLTSMKNALVSNVPQYKMYKNTTNWKQKTLWRVNLKYLK